MTKEEELLYGESKMTKEELLSELKEHLKIEVKLCPSPWDDGKLEISVTLFFDDEIICTDKDSIKY